MCVCEHVHVYMSICIHVPCTHVFLPSACSHVSMQVCTHTCVCACTCLHVGPCVCVCMHMFACGSVHACIQEKGRVLSLALL